MISGVLQSSLQQIVDDRGKVMHMLRATDPYFDKFGEVYFSWINPRIIKAWSKHLCMALNYTVPVGKIKLVLFDDRDTSETQGEVNEFIMSAEDYYLLTIPCGIWYGFTSVGNGAAMVVNCATLPHDPNEIVRINYQDGKIPYNW